MEGFVLGRVGEPAGLHQFFFTCKMPAGVLRHYLKRVFDGSMSGAVLSGRVQVVDN